MELQRVGHDWVTKHIEIITLSGSKIKFPIESWKIKHIYKLSEKKNTLNKKKCWIRNFENQMLRKIIIYKHKSKNAL